MEMAVDVIQKSCVGCASCAILAPNIFAFKKGRKSQVVKQPETASEHRELADAVNGCPVNAIQQHPRIH